MTNLTDKTITAHQAHWGTGEMSDLVLAKRIANGWTAAQIERNSFEIARYEDFDGGRADNRANGVYFVDGVRQ